MSTTPPNVIPITCSSACNKLKRRIPYGWDLNLYCGCAHGCKYCYAMGSHQHLGGNFNQDIYVKTNIIEHLERELAHPSWQRDIVNLGGVTDNYQPAEAHCKLMPEVLRLCIRYKTPVIISTKSALVLRDYDLIDELSRVAYVNVAASIITCDEKLQKTLEPGGAPTPQRFAVLSAFSKTNASTGLHCMPIVPFLTDGEENFDALFSEAAAAGVSYVLPGTLYLRGATRPAFMQFMAEAFPGLHPQFTALYKTGGAGKPYKDGLYQTVNRLRGKYKLSSSYTKPMREKMAQFKPQAPSQQLSFLPDNPENE